MQVTSSIFLFILLKGNSQKPFTLQPIYPGVLTFLAVGYTDGRTADKRTDIGNHRHIVALLLTLKYQLHKLNLYSIVFCLHILQQINNPRFSTEQLFSFCLQITTLLLGFLSQPKISKSYFQLFFSYALRQDLFLVMKSNLFDNHLNFMNTSTMEYLYKKVNNENLFLMNKLDVNQSISMNDVQYP